MVCWQEKPGGDCRRRNVTYITSCDICAKTNLQSDNADNATDTDTGEAFKYVGETIRSAYERGVEHQADYKARKEDSHILKHHLKAHPDLEEISFSMKIHQKHMSSFQRQVQESVLIETMGPDKILNSKGGFN